MPPADRTVSARNTLSQTPAARYPPRPHDAAVCPQPRPPHAAGDAAAALRMLPDLPIARVAPVRGHRPPRPCQPSFLPLPGSLSPKPLLLGRGPWSLGYAQPSRSCYTRSQSLATVLHHVFHFSTPKLCTCVHLT